MTLLASPLDTGPDAVDETAGPSGHFASAMTVLFPLDGASETWGTRRVAEIIASPSPGVRRPSTRFWARIAKTATVDLAGRDPFPAEITAALGGEASRPVDPGLLQKLLERRWGPQFRDPRATLALLRALPPTPMIERALSEWLIERSRVPGITPDEWTRAQAYCVLSEAYLDDLITLRSSLRKAGAGGEAQRLMRDLMALVDAESLDRARRIARAKKGILFVGLHSGATVFGRWSRNRILFRGKVLVMGAATNVAGRAYASVKADPARGLLTFIKHLRQEGALGAMAIDGPYGRTEHKMDVLGRPLSFGYGAPHAIYHSKCRNVFSLTRWEEDRFVYDLVPGPVPRPRESIQAWSDRYFESFRPFLENHLTGDPTNIRGHGGIWWKLSPSGRSGDGRDGRPAVETDEGERFDREDGEEPEPIR